ncbi:hypothetical protein [Aurantiacibacter aquimixticola]|uniref:Uncharacterized protein n=1 Tax=Aurantiacibacter aquimixticola TaxID=1958945 RepID=A0A419RS72_9SPHN|nr:hypothetical protein [Aurantiacibacter aquimixticola]RJY08625.1 hypothetical protein D6201_03950 [Aurantiacibacter aquimixticola]
MLTIATPLALLAAVPAQDAPPAAVQAPPFAAEQYAAFDFWIGEWDVHANGTDQRVGENTIERVSAGCAIRETWRPVQGGDGSITVRPGPTASI